MSPDAVSHDAGAPGLAVQVRLVLARELAVERGSLASTSTVLPFVVGAMLLAALVVSSQPAAGGTAAAGVVWLVVLLTAVPLARATAAAEQDDDAWDLLRALVRPGAVAAGKVLATWAVLLVTWAVAAAMAGAGLGAQWPPLAVVVAVLATLGLAADLVLLGAVLGASGARQGLLGALVVVAGLPAVLAGVQAAVDPAGLRWLALVVVWDAVTLAVTWACFPLLVEE